MGDAVRWGRAAPLLVGALAALLAGCNDGQGVEEDRCSGIGGDPFIPTSCVVVRGSVLDPNGGNVASAYVAVDCFGPNVLECHGLGQSDGDGSYRILVLNFTEDGGPAQVLVRVWDRVGDRRGVSDTAQVTFQPPGELAVVYYIDIHLTDAPSELVPSSR